MLIFFYNLKFLKRLTNIEFQTVSALTLDPSGARLITGGYDYDVKFWDFAGMDTSLRPFRTIRPFGDHQVRKINVIILFIFFSEQT